MHRIEPGLGVLPPDQWHEVFVSIAGEGKEEEWVCPSCLEAAAAPLDWTIDDPATSEPPGPTV